MSDQDNIDQKLRDLVKSSSLDVIGQFDPKATPIKFASPLGYREGLMRYDATDKVSYILPPQFFQNEVLKRTHERIGTDFNIGPAERIYLNMRWQKLQSLQKDALNGQLNADDLLPQDQWMPGLLFDINNDVSKHYTEARKLHHQQHGMQPYEPEVKKPRPNIVPKPGQQNAASSALRPVPDYYDAEHYLKQADAKDVNAEESGMLPSPQTPTKTALPVVGKPR